MVHSENKKKKIYAFIYMHHSKSASLFYGMSQYFSLCHPGSLLIYCSFTDVLYEVSMYIV